MTHAPGTPAGPRLRRPLLAAGLLLAVSALLVGAPVAAGALTAPAPPAAPDVPAAEPTAEEAEVTRLVNAERARAGCAAVVHQAQLHTAARLHSQDMADNGYFDHTSKDGRKPWDRARAAGYPSQFVGENIAMGQRDAQAVTDAWMNSAGHRANILNCQYRSTAVGVVVNAGKQPLWTQMFGGQ
ncbi:hypothetical protein GCM10010124_21150 [Pilimelia terevasa]|uniref:SCP domain-containing protein n=1 Tax=Pilimelia terevasa TaxID=53372 RepID=A0A8J3BP03_9ACTN|nr:CAP domain-containing protein [Pilimelia terevasa]GGK28277.1 hypothetical protein GCM10010124_21150 [Pilimelia terevasa]